MANRERGERSIEINGDMYTLTLDIEAMCALEELFSTPDKDVVFDQVMERAAKGSIRHLRAIWWACFQRYHPQITIEKASAFIVDIGGLRALEAKLLEVASATRPDKRDVPTKGKGKTARPQQAQGAGGTGGNSSSRPAQPA